MDDLVAHGLQDAERGEGFLRESRVRHRRFWSGRLRGGALGDQGGVQRSADNKRVGPGERDGRILIQPARPADGFEGDRGPGARVAAGDGAVLDLDAAGPTGSEQFGELGQGAGLGRVRVEAMAAPICSARCRASVTMRAPRIRRRPGSPAARSRA